MLYYLLQSCYYHEEATPPGSPHRESWEHTSLVLVVVGSAGVDLLRAAREQEELAGNHEAEVFSLSA